MNWQRARSDEQIARRIDELVDACARLDGRVAFEEITISALAAEAGWTRSNVYKYFKTREEVFLELLVRDVAAWRAEVIATFDGPVEPAAFVTTWTEVLRRHDRMARLTAIVATVLEKNCSLERLIDFKVRLRAEFAQVAGLLAAVLPFPTPAAAGEFLFAEVALTVGLHPLWSPTPRQREAMEASGWSEDPAQFEGMYRRALGAMLAEYLEG